MVQHTSGTKHNHTGWMLHALHNWLQKRSTLIKYVMSCRSGIPPKLGDLISGLLPHSSLCLLVLDPTKGIWKGLVPSHPKTCWNLEPYCTSLSWTFNLRHKQQLQQCKVWFGDFCSMAHETAWNFTTQGFLTARRPNSSIFPLTSRSHEFTRWAESFAEVPGYRGRNVLLLLLSLNLFSRTLWLESASSIWFPKAPPPGSLSLWFEPKSEFCVNECLAWHVYIYIFW